MSGWQWQTDERLLLGGPDGPLRCLQEISAMRVAMTHQQVHGHAHQGGRKAEQERAGEPGRE